MYTYNFYLGYDDDDKYYVDNNEQIINYLNAQLIDNTSFTMMPIYNKKSKLSEIWTELAFKAVSENNEFLYQLGDDIEFLDSDWEYYFIKQLKKQDNVGVVGPLDINNKSVLTQSFVNKKHLEIFNYYYPHEIKNMFIDDWIENVYKDIFNNRSFKFNNIRVKNSGGEYRYVFDQNNVKEIYIKQLEQGKQILKKYLEPLL